MPAGAPISSNFLFVNHGNGEFEEIGAPAGIAYSEAGRPRSGLGVDSADFNQDGWMDLFVANIDHEMYSLYQNNHDETFDDKAGATWTRNAACLFPSSLQSWDSASSWSIAPALHPGRPSLNASTFR